MPMYTYKCYHCTISKEVIRPMSESDDIVQCDECSRVIFRDFAADLFHTAGDTYDRPIISDSLAVSVDQIEEHKKAFPDVEITKEGQPVLRSYAQHEAYLKKVGFVKQPQKKKRICKKVTTKSV